MKPNIFVQIGLHRTCELAEITKDPQLFEPEDSLSNDIWTFPKEVLDRIGTKHVVGVDMDPKSIKWCKDKYKNYKNVGFIHAAIIEEPAETIIFEGWRLEGSNEQIDSFTSLPMIPQEVPALTLSQLFEKLQDDGDIIVCAMDVEGYENRILKGHNWKIKPHFFLIEGHTTHRTNLCISILLNNGYNLCDYTIHSNPDPPNYKQGYIKSIRKDISVYHASGKHAGDDWQLDEV